MQLFSLKIGHHTDTKNGTGLTVFICPQNTVASYYLVGSAPATREINLLDPSNMVEHIDALVFTGGSAFGLGCADGVMRYLVEQERGFSTAGGLVPIVPTASIYDLTHKTNHKPTANDAYMACQKAKPIQKMLNKIGSIGAGTGATIGKLFPQAKSMKGGFGTAEVNNDNIVVYAFAVVNCVGDVYNETGKIIAGAQDVKTKGWFNTDRALLRGQLPNSEITKPIENTTLVAIFTNANLTKAQLARIARAASAGMARAIKPIFTLYDGDVLFAASTGEYFADELQVISMATEAVRLAILNSGIQ